MDHKQYIGLKLKDFIKDTPPIAINYYYIIHCGRCYALKDMLNSEFVDKQIVSISELHADYTYDIKIK